MLQDGLLDSHQVLPCQDDIAGKIGGYPEKSRCPVIGLNDVIYRSDM